MKTKILVTAAFVLTFAAGVLTGAIALREYRYPPPSRARLEHEPGRPRPLQLETLQAQLNLSATQSQRVGEIIATHHDQLRKHFSEMRPQSHQIIKEMTMQIDSVLTPEQRQKFHANFSFPPPFWKLPRRSRRAPHDSLAEKF